jgi:hypothetical protein
MILRQFVGKDIITFLPHTVNAAPLISIGSKLIAKGFISARNLSYSCMRYRHKSYQDYSSDELNEASEK